MTDNDPDFRSVKEVEDQIRAIEGFSVRFLHHDGRDIRSDKKNVPRYPFREPADDELTVAKWKQSRFGQSYPGWKVEVLWSHRKPATGGTLLRTVRASYHS